MPSIEPVDATGKEKKRKRVAAIVDEILAEDKSLFDKLAKL